MKKDILKHLLLFTLFFAVAVVVKRYFSLMYAVPFVAGGLLGTFLPYLDHLVYVYFLKPHELSSQRVSSRLNQSDLIGVVSVLGQTRAEREKLIFHTGLFHLLFIAFAFFVVSSSGSLLGRGLVIAFLFSLSLDQLRDLMATGTIERWFSEPPLKLDLDQKYSTIYWAASFGVLVFLALVF